MSEDFEMIQIDVSDEDKITLIEQFVRTKLSPASQSAYINSDGECVEDALFEAVLNEMILQALIDHIEDQKDEPRVFMTENEIERMESVITSLR